MQNNEFEKQVQKKMDELKLAPSSEVWQKVEASLPKEKNRRWLIFAFLFATLSTTTLLLVNNEPAHNKNTVQLPLQKNHIAALEQKNDNNTMPAQNEIKKSPEQEKQAFSNNTVNSDAADNTLKTGSPSPITTHSAGEDIPVKMEIKDQPDPLNHTADPVSSNINNEKK